MISLLKTTIVITVLTAMAIVVLGKVRKPSLRPNVQFAAPLTGLAFLMLCVGQVALAFVGLAAVAAGFARKRAVGAGVALFLMITLPQVDFPVIAGSLQLFSMTTIGCIGLGLLIASLGWQRQPGSYSIVRDFPAVMMVLVLLFIGARGSSVTNVMRVMSDVVLAFVIPYVVVRRGLHDAASIRNAVLLVIAGGMAISAVAMFESVRVWPMYQIYGQQFGTLVVANVKMRGGMLRAGGPMTNPPLSGAILAMCFVLAFSARDLFRTTMGHRIVLAIMVMGLFSMQTRSAWLGAACGTIGVIYSRRGAAALAKYLPILLVAGGLIYGVAMVNTKVAGLVGFSNDAQDSNSYRDRLSDQGMAIVKEHPLIGQPIEAVTAQMANMRQGEGIIDFVNGYLSVALFSGLIGLALFGGALVLQAYNTQAAKKAARRAGAGSLADSGLGVVLAAASMFPVIPTDSRVICIMLLLFVLSNAMERNFRVPQATARQRGAAPADTPPAFA